MPDLLEYLDNTKGEISGFPRERAKELIKDIGPRAVPVLMNARLGPLPISIAAYEVGMSLDARSFEAILVAAEDPRFT